MTVYYIDISQVLAADVRRHLSELEMTSLVLQCGGVVGPSGDHVKVAGMVISGENRISVLNLALDLIATRPDVWPGGPGVA